MMATTARNPANAHGSGDEGLAATTTLSSRGFRTTAVEAAPIFTQRSCTAGDAPPPSSFGLPASHPFDFARSEMHIERALHYDETLPPGERYVIGPVKGGRPRTITFDDTCAALLQGWREELPAALAAAENLNPLHGLRSSDPSSHRCRAVPPPSLGCWRLHESARVAERNASQR